MRYMGRINNVTFRQTNAAQMQKFNQQICTHARTHAHRQASREKRDERDHSVSLNEALRRRTKFTKPFTALSAIYRPSSSFGSLQLKQNVFGLVKLCATPATVYTGADTHAHKNLVVQTCNSRDKDDIRCNNLPFSTAAH